MADVTIALMDLRSNETILLTEVFAERPLTAIHWMLEQVTAMVGSMVVPEGE